MPLYEYRPKSGECAKCGGCFVDLQKMSEAAHTSCPDCGQACERVISAPMVSVRGANYKSSANAEKRAETMTKISNLEKSKGTLKSPAARGESGGSSAGSGDHNHDCSKHGCAGESTARRYGLLPHLVGSSSGDKSK